MSKRVLVTGANGFAARYLIPLLADAGYKVYGLGHNGNSHSTAPEGAEAILEADLRSISDLRPIMREVQPSHVVHLAAISSVVHDNVFEIYETNIVGSRNILVSLSELNKRPDSVLLISSANIYGNSVAGITSEDIPPNPANDYGVSKIGMEYMSRQFDSQLPIVIARPFNYTGRGQSSAFLVPKIVEHFKEKASYIELGNVDVARDFSDVRSVVRYIKLLLEVPAAVGGIFNLCSGVPHSLQFVFDTCKRITGHEMEIRLNPHFVRKNEIKTMAGNPAKLHSVVGVVPGYSLEETLEWMLGE